MVGWFTKFSVTSPGQVSVLSLRGIELILQHHQEIPRQITQDFAVCKLSSAKYRTQLFIVRMNWVWVPILRAVKDKPLYFPSLHSLGDLGWRWSRSLPCHRFFFFSQSALKMLDTRVSSGEQRKRDFEALPAVCIRRQFGWFFRAGGKRAFNVKVTERSLRKKELFFIFFTILGAKKFFRKLFASSELLFPLKKSTSVLAMKCNSFTNVI